MLASAPTARAELNISRFSVTPSTTEAGGHPNLDVSVAFEPPTADVKDIALHLPAGLTANNRAAPFCSRSTLVGDLCSLKTKVGSVALVGEALGIEATVVRNVYNVRPSGQERLRLGVPLFGSLTRGGLALTLPVNARPGDNGLDVAIAGPPREFAGYTVRIKSVTVRFKGMTKRRIRRTSRPLAFLTNPHSCAPATTVLEATAYVGPPLQVTQSSTFTPTGCAP